ncbi:Ig-like domain-containing protein [Altibacter sp. HG106]|uniref:Ig-like domain-containing protein n=1 Tax=Altibacter sp. HG106 TaxID=3023937 RepID=UPI00234FE146|nr:Ig-like domain-containing protein [Altibacter sp. HG106]MDC7995170.1 Ig-like domain-containing protein [Altibacter sp. HG106]
MKGLFRDFLWVFILLMSMTHCAKKGTPTGGAKDTIPPVIVRSSPENFSTNFEADEIRITFDEYIKLEKLQQNLIISPPLQYDPEITPISTSKQLRIKLSDTLRENTTYSINFGKSIVDNNEGNEFEYFKYVFSTGDYIDSLKLTGTVRDAQRLTPQGPATVLLYEVNDQYTDSIIYNEKPTYIAATKDSTYTYELSNLKEGTYRLVALREGSANYTFQPNLDEIAFYDEFITLPTDSSVTLTLFKEPLSYEIARPSHESKNHIIFGYSGNGDSLSLTPLSDLPEGFSSRVYKDRNKDTLHYWFKPAIDIEQQDTLYYLARNRGQVDTLTVRMKELYRDSLSIERLGTSSMLPRDTVQLAANTPLISFDAEKITVTNKDSMVIAHDVRIDTNYNTAEIIFEKEFEQRYNIELLPGAFQDFFEETNDSISFRVRTMAESDYGTILFNMTNLETFPVIVELLTTNYDVRRTIYLRENKNLTFDYLQPGTYFVRLTFDTNENNMWDSGSYLERRQPERVIFYPKQIEVRANWTRSETFTLTETNPGPVEIEADPEE